MTLICGVFKIGGAACKAGRTEAAAAAKTGGKNEKETVLPTSGDGSRSDLRGRMWTER